MRRYFRQFIFVYKPNFNHLTIHNSYLLCNSPPPPPPHYLNFSVCNPVNWRHAARGSPVSSCVSVSLGTSRWRRGSSGVVTPLHALTVERELSVQKTPKHGEPSHGRRAQELCVFGLFIRLFQPWTLSLVGNRAGGPVSFFLFLHPRTSG